MSSAIEPSRQVAPLGHLPLLMALVEDCARQSLYTGWQPPRRSTLDPKPIRGQQCAEAPLGCRRSDPVAAWQCSRQSRALAGGLTAEPSWLPSAACAAAAHSNTVRRPSGVVVPRMSGCPPCLGRRVRVLRQRPRVQRPPVQCLTSGTVQRPRVRCPRGWCPMSGVQCPVSVSGVRCPVRASGVRVRCPVRASGIRVHFGRTGELVERLGAAGSHTSRDRLRRVTYLTRGSLSLD
jgi:hypothetical protein